MRVNVTLTVEKFKTWTIPTLGVTADVYRCDNGYIAVIRDVNIIVVAKNLGELRDEIAETLFNRW